MKDEHLKIIEEISAASHRKRMAEKAEEMAKRSIKMSLAKLKEAGFKSGNYMISGHLCEIKVYCDGIAVNRIKIMK